MNFKTFNLYQLSVIPESKFIEVLSEDANTNVDGIARFDIREFNVEVFNGYRMIVVNEALATQSEDVTQAQKRPGNGPRAE